MKVATQAVTNNNDPERYSEGNVFFRFQEGNLANNDEIIPFYEIQK